MNLVMFRESFRLSLKSIASNPIRSFLTTLGVIIGVASVIILVALGNGTKAAVDQSLQSLGTNLMIVYSGQQRGQSIIRRSSQNVVPTLTEGDLEFVQSLGPEWVLKTAPELSAFTQMKAANLNSSPSVVGTTPEYQDIRNFHVAYGQFFSEQDVKTRKPVVVLGAQVQKDLFGDREAVGQKVRIKGISFKVLGVMEEKGSSMTDNVAFIPISAYQRYISGQVNYAAVNVEVASLDTMKELQQIVEQQLLRRHKLSSMDNADFYVATQVDLMGTLQGVTGSFTLFLTAIAAISLVVGGIGIMNIMLVSVTERTREIGIRVALGAKPSDIMQQFIIEATILTLGGGLVGVLIGLVSSWGVRRFMGMASVVSPDSILLAFVSALCMGLFFGGYPAYRASRLDPIEALRYE
jgi:putative ABC transport system permease protein